MNLTSPDGPSRIVRSPAVSPSRPLSIRHLSADLDNYIDMYGLNQGIQDDRDNSHLEGTSQHDFLSSNDVAQELKNLQNLRRISLDGSKLDPDVPPQNFQVTPTLKTHTQEDGESEADTDKSLYWVPARIHPELAPHEWQSFVQKRDARQGDDSFAGPLRSPSLKGGLSRSRSLLSQEVNGNAAERYSDAGPELERRRSKLRPDIKVRDLENISMEEPARGRPSDMIRRTSETSIPEESPSELGSDEPILIPPPGQILRRAARTGKGRGSYRKLGRSRTPPIPSEGHSEPLRVEDSQVSPQEFGSETIQLRDDAPRDKTGVADINMIGSAEVPMARKKSSNRAVQIVGPASQTTREHLDINAQGEIPSQPIASVRDGGVATPEPSSRAKVDPNHRTVESVAYPTDVPSNVSQQQIPIRHIEEPRPSRPNIIGTAEVPGTANPSTSAPAFVAQDKSRPGLKRELSAASLTRAVMNGTAPPPAAATKSPPRRVAAVETASESSSVSSTGVKKSAWGKLFSSDEKDKSKMKKDSKSGPKIGHTSSQERASQEKDHASMNLFSSIFGSKKKEKDIVLVDTTKREVPSSQRSAVREPHFYSRYPIQLERAIYRMAHLKLGNSRRPLVHQVLLSNFMYGYLALVGANTSGQAQGPSGGHKVRSRSPQRSIHSKDNPETSENQWKAGVSSKPNNNASGRVRRDTWDSETSNRGSPAVDIDSQSASKTHHAVQSSSTPPDNSQTTMERQDEARQNDQHRDPYAASQGPKYNVRSSQT